MLSSPFHNAFPQLVLPLSLSDWERLPRNPAYRYEYFDNRAVLTPRADTRSALLKLATWQPVRFRRPLFVRTLVDNDWADLGPVFHSAFAGQLPYTCLSTEEGRDLAEACLAYTRQGKDGEIVPEACVTAHDDRGLVGAALVTLQSSAKFELQAEVFPVPHLTWIFVHNFAARRGGGRALLQEVVRRLLDLGHHYLTSTFLVGNSVSTLWHWQMGFSLVPEGLSRLFFKDEDAGNVAP